MSRVVTNSSGLRSPVHSDARNSARLSHWASVAREGSCLHQRCSTHPMGDLNESWNQSVTRFLRRLLCRQGLLDAEMTRMTRYRSGYPYASPRYGHILALGLLRSSRQNYRFSPLHFASERLRVARRLLFREMRRIFQRALPPCHMHLPQGMPPRPHRPTTRSSSLAFSCLCPRCRYSVAINFGLYIPGACNAPGAFAFDSPGIGNSGATKVRTGLFTLCADTIPTAACVYLFHTGAPLSP